MSPIAMIRDISFKVLFLKRLSRQLYHERRPRQNANDHGKSRHCGRRFHAADLVDHGDQAQHNQPHDRRREVKLIAKIDCITIRCPLCDLSSNFNN